MYEIVKNIPKPPDLKAKQPGSKYPLSTMEVGDSFVVPYTEMEKGDTGVKFRNRIYKSCRNYALRDFNDRSAEYGNDERSDPSNPAPVKKEFSAVLMDKDDTEKLAADGKERWVQGDVVVWRDK